MVCAQASLVNVWTTIRDGKIYIGAGEFPSMALLKFFCTFIPLPHDYPFFIVCPTSCYVEDMILGNDILFLIWIFECVSIMPHIHGLMDCGKMFIFAFIQVKDFLSM